MFLPFSSGKTTLIKMILGQEKPDSGEIKIGETVKIVSVGQDRMDQLNSENTVFQEISEGLDELELGTQTVNSRAYLSWFGFKSAQQQAFVGNLSGGERNRVQLAKLVKAGAYVWDWISNSRKTDSGCASFRRSCSMQVPFGDANLTYSTSLTFAKVVTS